MSDHVYDRQPDAIRDHIVTQLVCAKCDNPLQLSYHRVKRQPAGRSSMIASDPSCGMTGAATRIAHFAVHPCKKCYGDATRPLEQMKAALDALTAAQTK